MDEKSKRIGKTVDTVEDEQGREVRIVVGQRGFVHVGYYHAAPHEIALSHARCVRRWGTDKGLNQLRNGPLEATVLDAPSVVRMHPLAIVHTVDCNPEKWAPYLLESGD